jgi:hypothetical protein
LPMTTPTPKIQLKVAPVSSTIIFVHSLFQPSLLMFSVAFMPSVRQLQDKEDR